MDRCTESDNHRLPIPQRQFNWYVGFWHVIYLGSLVWLATFVIYDWWQGLVSVRNGLLLLGLLLIQATLYLRLIWFNPNWERQWPLPARDLWLYFGGSLFCWAIEWQIEPGFFWFVMSYVGQMFGILPPLAAILGTTTLYFLVQARINEWNVSNWNQNDWLGQLMGWLSMMVIYLFIWYLVRTSSERGRLVTELQQAQTELALAREKELELATLRERERLARDLHDGLGHALVAMSVQLEAIQRLYQVDPERGSAHVDELKSLVRRSMDELRRSLAGLRSPGLGERTLSVALQELVLEVSERSALVIRCQAPTEVDHLRPAVAETLWRVAQESLTNVEKHAQAHSVDLILSLEPQQVLLRIIDDGVGKRENAELSPGHFGLRGLRERVEGLGGNFLVTGQPIGTEVMVALPLL